MDSDSVLDVVFPHTEAALVDVKRLHSDSANKLLLLLELQAHVEDASVLAPVARAAAKRLVAIKLREPRRRTEAEHHSVSSRMRERKLEISSERQHAASENTMRDCVEALHKNGIAKHSEGKERNACLSSFALLSPGVGDRVQPGG